MTATSTANRNFPLPGGLTTSKRLSDVRAIREALIQIDLDLNTALAQRVPLSHVGSSGAAHAVATTAAAGFLSAADKQKLDGIAAGATVAPVTSVNSKSGGAITLTVADIVNCGTNNIPQVLKSVDYALVMTDSGKHVMHPTADVTARTFTIPANSVVPYDIGTGLTFVCQHGAGSITIACGDTMYLAGAGTTGNRTLAANGVATALKVTATEWLISGTNLT